MLFDLKVLKNLKLDHPKLQNKEFFFITNICKYFAKLLSTIEYKIIEFEFFFAASDKIFKDLIFSSSKRICVNFII